MGSNIAMVAPDPPGVPRERGALKIIGIWQQNVPYPTNLTFGGHEKHIWRYKKIQGEPVNFFRGA